MRIANVGWEVREPDGRLVASGRAANVAADGMRSAFAIAVASAQSLGAADTARVPNFWVFGTGSATAMAQDAALQFPVTSKKTGDREAIGTSGLTARLVLALGHLEMTGTIREVGLMHKPHASANNHLFARAVLNGGTGIAHPSGTVAGLAWDLVLSTGSHSF